MINTLKFGAVIPVEIRQTTPLNQKDRMEVAEAMGDCFSYRPDNEPIPFDTADAVYELSGGQDPVYLVNQDENGKIVLIYNDGPNDSEGTEAAKLAAEGRDEEVRNRFLSRTDGRAPLVVSVEKEEKPNCFSYTFSAVHPDKETTLTGSFAISRKPCQH